MELPSFEVYVFALTGLYKGNTTIHPLPVGEQAVCGDKERLQFTVAAMTCRCLQEGTRVQGRGRRSVALRWEAHLQLQTRAPFRGHLSLIALLFG